MHLRRRYNVTKHLRTRNKSFNDMLTNDAIKLYTVQDKPINELRTRRRREISTVDSDDTSA